MFATGFEAKNRQQAVEKYYGKYPGIVTNNKARDDNGHRGEVQVEVPGILEDRENQHLPLKAWAKPCFLPRFFFVPEIGDHVWVEFAAGDINFPIWSGVWYPIESVPQTVDGKAPTESQKLIRTITGSIIEIDDTGKITITDTGNDTSVVSKKINLGTLGGAREHLVLGETLKAKLEELIGIIEAHTHPTGVGPSGFTVDGKPGLTSLRTSLQQIMSKQNTTD